MLRLLKVLLLIFFFFMNLPANFSYWDWVSRFIGFIRLYKCIVATMQQCTDTEKKTFNIKKSTFEH